MERIDTSPQHLNAATGDGRLNAEALRSELLGELITPADEAYHSTAGRLVWNADIDKYPAGIVRCADVADVLAAIRFSREQGLPIAVRCAGHNISGSSTIEGGLVIDLRPMRGVRVDPGRQSVRAQAGCTWRDVDHATAAFGLATTGGVNSITGIAGLTLGGGIGWLMRDHGLACDNLIGADVVTAEGDFVTCSASTNSDLFWGLRGGGGNFGIVTEFEYQLHPVDVVLSGTLMWPAEKARDVLRLYREFSQDEPRSLTTFLFLLDAPEGPFLPSDLHGKPMIAIAGCFAGDLEEGNRAFAPLRAFGPPVADSIAPMRYRDLQCSSDAEWQNGFGRYWKSDYMDDLTDPAIDIIVDHCARYVRPKMPTRATDELVAQPSLYFELGHMAGAIRDLDPASTAVGHRDAAFLHVITTRWSRPEDREIQVQWARDLWQALSPFTRPGGYVNYLGSEGADRVRDSYGQDKYDRLVELKTAYDPTNVFASNQNIQPRERLTT